MKCIQFGIVGGGWRTEFYLRIAMASPQRFHITGIVVRDEEKARLLEQTWGVKTYRNIGMMLEHTSPSFVVSSVPWAANPTVVEELLEREIPVLSETPPAPDLERLVSLYKKWGQAKIQVAEQYLFQPIHVARLALVQSGKLGTVTQAQISVAHGYHGMSMMRKMLGIGFDNAEVHAYSFVSPIVNGPGRQGNPREEKTIDSEQTVATLNFGGKLGIYDFAGDQYFSWIRSPRVLIRGEKGEIHNNEVRYLKDYLTPVSLEMKRMNAGEDGNLEGYFHKGILTGDEWVYKNPFIPSRLSDDEIAIATCLSKMHEYVQSGADFYNLAEACQDHYLALVIQEAVKAKRKIRTESQVWSKQ